MNEITLTIPQNYIIEFIKQNVDKKKDYIFTNSNNYFFINSNKDLCDCFIKNFEDPNNHYILKYGDYDCRLYDNNKELLSDLSKTWKSFILSIISKHSNEKYSIINPKLVVATYMQEMSTNIAANTELAEWADFLQKELTRCDEKAIVLFDDDNLLSLQKRKNDDLLQPVDKGFLLHDDCSEEDLSDYILSNTDEDILETVCNAKAKYSKLKTEHTF